MENMRKRPVFIGVLRRDEGVNGPAFSGLPRDERGGVPDIQELRTRMPG
jgi:hypothetical protein